MKLVLTRPYVAILTELAVDKGTALQLMERGNLGHLIYGRLRDLESQGLVNHTESDPIPERGNRPRFTYWLTDAGRAVLKGTAS